MTLKQRLLEEKLEHHRHKNCHMTNIYLTNSDEGAIVVLGKTTRSCTTKLMNISKTKEGVSLRKICQQFQAVCQGVQDLV